MTPPPFDTKTWTEEILEADDLNAYVSDPLEALAEPPADFWAGGDFYTDAGDYVTVTGSELAVTLQRTGNLRVACAGYTDSVYDHSYFLGVELDDVLVPILEILGDANVLVNGNLGFYRLFPNLPAGTHIVRLMAYGGNDTDRGFHIKGFSAEGVV